MIMFIDSRCRPWFVFRDGKILIRLAKGNEKLVREPNGVGRSNREVEQLIRAVTLQPSKSCEVIGDHSRSSSF